MRLGDICKRIDSNEVVDESGVLSEDILLAESSETTTLFLAVRLYYKIKP